MGPLIAALVLLLCLSMPAISSAQTAFTGVWHPGSGAQWWRLDMTYKEFVTQNATHYGNGLRIEDIEIAGGKYTAVWRPGSGVQEWQTDLDWSQLQAATSSYYEAGLRITDLEISGGLFTAVFQPGSGDQRLHPGMSYSTFHDLSESYHDAGLRLVDIEIEDGKYTAVWRKGNGAQWWRTGMTFNQFVDADASYLALGLRLIDVEIEAGKYTALWGPGSGQQAIYSGLCFGDFKTEDKVHFDLGLRLVDLELHDGGAGLYRLPFNSGPDFWVSQGNWDEPTWGHNLGDPNGVQSHAFDFIYDGDGDGEGEEGFVVRAVRAGTVIEYRDNRSCNTWGVPATGHPCSGAPGEGNYILIRHPDGTVASYGHLMENALFVYEGEDIARGQIIALSGNTGNSSTPHLHMDLRSYWNSATDLGPTMRILFQDKNHACWVPRVGDVLDSNND